jgi:hypothetical protein
MEVVADMTVFTNSLSALLKKTLTHLGIFPPPASYFRSPSGHGKSIDAFDSKLPYFNKVTPQCLYRIFIFSGENSSQQAFPVIIVFEMHKAIHRKWRINFAFH